MTLYMAKIKKNNVEETCVAGNNLRDRVSLEKKLIRLGYIRKRIDEKDYWYSKSNDDRTAHVYEIVI